MNLWTPKMDERIEAEYRTRQRGACKRLALEFGLSSSYVSFRARVLGCRALRASSARDRPWSAVEDRILIDHGHEPAAVLVRRFARLGRTGRTQDMIYRRAVVLVREGAMEPLGQPRDGRYTPDEICAAMGVCRRTFSKWVNAGALKVERAGEARLFVKRRDLRRFLVDGVMLYEPGRCDKFWLVDVLAGDLRSAPRGRPPRGDAATARLAVEIA